MAGTNGTYRPQCPVKWLCNSSVFRSDKNRLGGSGGTHDYPVLYYRYIAVFVYTINYCIMYHVNIIDIAFMTIFNPLLKVPWKYVPRQIVPTRNSLQNWHRVFSCILKMLYPLREYCCSSFLIYFYITKETLSSQSYQANHRGLNTVATLVISSKLSKWRPKTTFSADFNFLLSILVQKILVLNDNLVYVSLHTRAK